jgi:hypothetical protein
MPFQSGWGKETDQLESSPAISHTISIPFEIAFWDKSCRHRVPALLQNLDSTPKNAVFYEFFQYSVRSAKISPSWLSCGVENHLSTDSLSLQLNIIPQFL